MPQATPHRTGEGKNRLIYPGGTSRHAFRAIPVIPNQALQIEESLNGGNVGGKTKQTVCARPAPALMRGSCAVVFNRNTRPEASPKGYLGYPQRLSTGTGPDDSRIYPQSQIFRYSRVKPLSGTGHMAPKHYHRHPYRRMSHWMEGYSKATSQREVCFSQKRKRYTSTT